VGGKAGDVGEAGDGGVAGDSTGTGDGSGCAEITGCSGGGGVRGGVFEGVVGAAVGGKAGLDRGERRSSSSPPQSCSSSTSLRLFLVLFAGGDFGSRGDGNGIGVSVGGVRVDSKGVSGGGVRGGSVPLAGALRIGSSEADAAGLLLSTVAVAVVPRLCRWRRRQRLLAGAFAVLLGAGRLHNKNKLMSC
jgi:hypothetical protein